MLCCPAWKATGEERDTDTRRGETKNTEASAVGGEEYREEQQSRSRSTEEKRQKEQENMTSSTKRQKSAWEHADTPPYSWHKEEITHWAGSRGRLTHFFLSHTWAGWTNRDGGLDGEGRRLGGVSGGRRNDRETVKTKVQNDGKLFNATMTWQSLLNTSEGSLCLSKSCDPEKYIDHVCKKWLHRTSFSELFLTSLPTAFTG